MLTTGPSGWIIKGLLILLFAFSTAPLYAADWKFSPTLTVQETYTDNVTLASSNEQSDYITEVNPGITIKAEGRRLNLDFNYRMQNLIYADDSDNNGTNHQLGATLNSELAEDFLYFDATASISQHNVSNTGRVSTDNLSVTGNRTDVQTYSLSPYIKRRLGGFANIEFRYTYDVTETDQGLSDSESNGVDFSLSSGSDFSNLGWKLDYNKEEVDRDSTTDADYESMEAEVRFGISRKIDMVAKAGNEDNSFNNSINTNDGSYWEAGINWHPSMKFSLEVLYGDRSQSVTTKINPSERTSFELGYRDREVGLIQGGNWNALFKHETRRSTWLASYSEEVTTLQDRLGSRLRDGLLPAYLARRDGSLVRIGGYDPVTNILYSNPQDYLSFTDEVFTSKQFRISTEFKTAKSDINASIFNENREYTVTTDDEESTGFDVSWKWRFATRTSSILKARWDQTNFRSSNREDERWDLSLGFSRDFRRDVKGTLDFRRLEVQSNDATNDYEENRITARLKINF